MNLKLSGGFSMPTSSETWIKVNFEVELTGEEIAKPKFHRVNERIDKGVKIITEQLEKHLDKQLRDIRGVTEKKTNDF